MDEKYNLLRKSFGDHRLKLNEPLRHHAYSRPAALAEAFYIATSAYELTQILDAAYELGLPYQVFGAGTKVVFPNPKLHGVVIKNRTAGIKIGAVKGKVGREGIGVEEALVEADSGVSLARLNEFLSRQNLVGVSSPSLIESTLGSLVRFDAAVQSLVQKIRVWERGRVEEVALSQLRNGQIILSIILKVKSQSLS